MSVMRILHRFGPKRSANFNLWEEFVSCKDPVSFDGVYLSVYEHFKKYPEVFAAKPRIIFFVTEFCLGKDNSYEPTEPPSNFCTAAQVKEMADALPNSSIGFHSKNHRHMDKGLSKDEIRNEMMPSIEIQRIMSTPWIFAYPYGNFNDTCIEVARELGYKEAWSVTQGNDTDFAKKRYHIWWGKQP